MTPPGLIPQNPNQEITTEAANLYGSHVYWAGPRSSWRRQKRCTVLLRIVHHYPNLIYFYAVPYFMTSWYVHSNVMWVRALFPAGQKSSRSFGSRAPFLYAKSPSDRLAGLQIGYLYVTGARLDARKFFWGIEVLAQSFAKL